MATGSRQDEPIPCADSDRFNLVGRCRLPFNRRARSDAPYRKTAHRGRGYISCASKSITVVLDFFGECLLHDLPLLVVEYFLIWPPVSAIFRLRCDTERAVEWNIEVCEHFTQFC